MVESIRQTRLEFMIEFFKDGGLVYFLLAVALAFLLFGLSRFVFTDRPLARRITYTSGMIVLFIVLLTLVLLATWGYKALSIGIS